MFSSAVTDHWKQTFSEGDLLFADADFSITVNPALEDDENGTVLETGGKTFVSIRPALAAQLELKQNSRLSAQDFRQKLAENDIRLHGADYLFYFPAGAAAALPPQSGTVRQLTQADEAAFAQFCAASSEDDLDAAYVELDHWLVYGAFEEDKLVCAASMYPWNETKLADMGVLTLPAFRGKGHARNVVHAISKHASSLGYEPQYRCQLDNAASVHLAKSAGLHLFGTWDVIITGDESIESE
ncbi:MAG: GNAT family N-acetyltransferase [Brucellaceae bacterium]|jgi:RimJ/RimL family protein N-acetyltransferase|nr:GNAT family N-acetyltransferase [Brucellaceae bacterium]